MSPAEPGMRMVAVRIQDFRAIEHVVLPLGQMTVLVGENNAGKTSILEALAIALGSRRASPDDLRVGADRKRAERYTVDVLIQPAEGEEFDQALSEVVGRSVQVPDEGSAFIVLRSIGTASVIGGRLDERRAFLQGWSEDSAKAAEIPEVGGPVPRAWGERILFQLLDARRDLADDLGRRTSFWGRLSQSPELPADVASEVRESLSALGGRIAEQSPVLQRMKAALERVVDTAAAGSIELTPLPTEPDELLRALDILVKHSESAAIPLAQQGSGTRSLAALMVFRAFVELAQSQVTEQPLVLTALEEIEAHLHPQAARSIEPLLRSLPGQVLLSTHSPYVINRLDLAELRTVRRHGATVRIGTIGDLTPAELEDAKRWVQRHQSELLFAKLVVLVEGDSEEGMLEPLATARWSCAPGLRGMSIVSVSGAQNFKHFISVLERLDILWIALVDGDEEGVSGIQNAGKSIGRELSADSKEVVMLPDGHAIEEHLAAAGFRVELEATVAAIHGEDMLPKWRSMNHGAPAGKDKPARDYESDGWEERLVVDFLKKNKTGWGGRFAAACLAGQDRVPLSIAELLTLADERLAERP